MRTLPENIVNELKDGTVSYYRLISPCIDHSLYVTRMIQDLLKKDGRSVITTAVTNLGLHAIGADCSIFDYIHINGEEKKKSYQRILKTLESIDSNMVVALEKILYNEYIIIHELDRLEPQQFKYIVYILRSLSRIYAYIQSTIRLRIAYRRQYDKSPAGIIFVILDYYLTYITDPVDIDNVTHFFQSIDPVLLDINLADYIVNYMRTYSDRIGRRQYKSQVEYELIHLTIYNILSEFNTEAYEDICNEWHERNIVSSSRYYNGHQPMGYIKLILFDDPYIHDSKMRFDSLKINDIIFETLTLSSSSNISHELLMELMVGSSKWRDPAHILLEYGSTPSDELREYIDTRKVNNISEYEQTHIQLLCDDYQADELNQSMIHRIEQPSINYISYDGMIIESPTAPEYITVPTKIPSNIDILLSSQWSPRILYLKESMRVFITDTMLFQTIDGTSITIIAGQLGTLRLIDGLILVDLDAGETIIVEARWTTLTYNGIEYVRYQLPISPGYGISYDNARLLKFDRVLVHTPLQYDRSMLYHLLTRFRDDLRIVDE